MQVILTEAVVILLLILINGIFSLSELAVVSARRNRLEEKAEKGSKGAKTALTLAQKPNRFLSTVQIGITLIGILNGAFGGATIADEIAAWIENIPSLAHYSQGIAVTIVVLIITYLSLVMGELVPKRLALSKPEVFAEKLSGVMDFLSKIARPIVNFLSFSTDLTVRLLGVKPKDTPDLTEDDVRSLILQGTRMGIFEVEEQEMLDHLIRLDDRRIRAIMTPRTEIVFLEDCECPEKIVEVISQSPYSRYPVFHGSYENVTGFVHVRDLFGLLAEEKPLDLKQVIKPALFVPENRTALDVLAQMKKDRASLALVFDEFGGLEGMVTLRDFFEAIIGDEELPLVGEYTHVVKRADGSLLMDGSVVLDELMDILDLDQLPEQEKSSYETLAGMLMTMLGRIPATGDIYQWMDYSFEVVDMDGNRVDKVLVSPPKQ